MMPRQCEEKGAMQEDEGAGRDDSEEGPRGVASQKYEKRRNLKSSLVFPERNGA